MKEIKLNAKLSKIKTYARIKSIDFIINLKFTLGCYTRLRAGYACSIRDPVVASGRYPTDQELFRLKCV